VWAALRFGTRGAAIANFIVTSLAIWGTVNGSVVIASVMNASAPKKVNVSRPRLRIVAGRPRRALSVPAGSNRRSAGSPAATPAAISAAPAATVPAAVAPEPAASVRPARIIVAATATTTP